MGVAREVLGRDGRQPNLRITPDLGTPRGPSDRAIHDPFGLRALASSAGRGAEVHPYCYLKLHGPETCRGPARFFRL